MMKFLVTADGGLTTMGYVTFVVAVIVLIAIIAVLFFKTAMPKADHSAAGYLRCGFGTGICYFVH